MGSPDSKGLQYADNTATFVEREDTQPKKEVHWAWHKIASHGEALVLENVKYCFIAITLWSTLTQ